MITAPERNEERTFQQPRVKARGHLSLVEWEGTTSAQPQPSGKISDPVRRSPLDRLYWSGILFLLITTLIAVVASLTHL